MDWSGDIEFDNILCEPLYKSLYLQVCSVLKAYNVFNVLGSGVFYHVSLIISQIS